MNEKILAQADKNYTAEEYSNIERSGTTKHQFANGKVLATAGSNRMRSLIASNTTIAIGNRIHGQKNEIYAGNMRVQLNPGRVAYPDVVIVSGKPTFTDNQYDVLLNPAITVEIISKNTNFHDKTEKLECYLAMDSIREYVLIKEDEMRVEHYAKQNLKQWIYRIYNDREEIISLESINCKISLTEIYAQIDSEFIGKKVSG
jgi:Uma2 family endonuclease